MPRLLVHVEGPTEESFVNNVLRPHLVSDFGYADVSARLLGNARQRLRRGGIGGWNTARRDIVRHLREDSGAISTTMVDFYGMPQIGDRAWPGRDRANGMPFAQKAQVVQVEIARDVAAEVDGAQDRFLAYVVMHEYEGLLFSDPGAFAEAIGSRELADRFQAVRDQFLRRRR